MPRGPNAALFRAFKPGQPLSAEDFAALLDDYPLEGAIAAIKRAAAASSRPTSATRELEGSRERSR
jgi:hypothetical protein